MLSLSPPGTPQSVSVQHKSTVSACVCTRGLGSVVGARKERLFGEAPQAQVTLSRAATLPVTQGLGPGRTMRVYPAGGGGGAELLRAAGVSTGLEHGTLDVFKTCKWLGVTGSWERGRDEVWVWMGQPGARPWDRLLSPPPALDLQQTRLSLSSGGSAWLPARFPLQALVPGAGRGGEPPTGSPAPPASRPWTWRPFLVCFPSLLGG